MGSIRKAASALGGAFALLSSSSSALASDAPFAFGDAQRGSLRVVSGALITHRSAELRGVWLDEKLPCNQFRSLRVAAIIDYSRGKTSRTITRSRIGSIRNCAEGGPNFGFTIRAAVTVPRPEGNHPHLGLACPDGRWKPGFYTFTVRTTHRATKLSAFVSVGWRNKASC